MSSVSPTYDKRMTSVLCVLVAKKWEPVITLSQNDGNTFGIRWPYAIHTLAIRQLYASCMLNTLLNRPTYAKMSVYVADTLQIRCRYVADTSDIRQTYVISKLFMRY